MVMKKVGIADLKSRLSEYLRAVRRGETIAVMDRQTPVAQIVPIRQGMVLRVREPAPGTPAPNYIPSPKPLNLNIDIVQLLLEETQGFRCVERWVQTARSLNCSFMRFVRVCWVQVLL